MCSAGQALNVIEAAKPTQPFFFYLALQVSHSPWEARPEDVAVVEAKVAVNATLADELDPNGLQQLGMSAVIDEAVKNVTTALKQRGLWEQTLLVFSSDNGAPEFNSMYADSNTPLRGYKPSSPDHAPLAGLRTVVRRPPLTLRAGRVFTSSYLMLGRGQALVSACEANVMLTLRCACAKPRYRGLPPSLKR